MKPSQCLGSFIVRFRIPIIVITILLTTAFGLCMLNFEFENDMTQWVDKNSPTGRLPYYINETFGSNSPLLIALKTDNVFSKENLVKLKAFCSEVAQMPGVKGVYSITTVNEILPTTGGIEIKKLIPEPLPEEENSLIQLGQRILKEKKYTGRLVSADGTATLIAISLYFQERSDLIARDIKHKALQFFPAPAKLYFSGNSFLLSSIADLVVSDISFLVPLVTILVCLVLFISFRKLRGVFLPLLTVLLATTLTLGIMAALQIPLNVLSSAVPVLLIAVGSAYGIHVLSHYYEQVNSQGRNLSPQEVVSKLLGKVGLPVLMAGLTTCAGFISNLTAEVSIIKTFGVFTALGVFLAVVISLFFLPALLSLLPLPKLKDQSSSPAEQKQALSATSLSRRISSKVASLLVKFRLPLISFFIVLSLLAGLSASHITAEVDILGYFAENSEPRQASNFINQNFEGFNPLSIYVKGEITDPALLKILLIISEEIKAQAGLNQASGLPEIICELNYALNGLSSIPETKAEVENLLFFVEGQSMLESMLTSDKKECLVTVLLPSMDNNYLEAIFKATENSIKDFRDGYTVIPLDYQQPFFQKVASLWLGNLLRSEKIQTDQSQLTKVISHLIERAQGFTTFSDLSQVLNYVQSDEAEIIMSDSEIEALKVSLAELSDYRIESIQQAITASLADNDLYLPAEIEGFSKSIWQILSETKRQAKLAALSQILLEGYPGLSHVQAERINYALAPFCWETIPVSKQALLASSWTAEQLLPESSTQANAIEKIELSGTAKLIEDIRKNIFSNQLISILISLLGVLILNTLSFRSFKEGLISLIPISLTIIFNFGLMGLLGIPLDFVTAIIAGAAIGTGIDYTIHFVSRYNLEKQSGLSDTEAISRTLSSTGKAIIFNAWAVGLGFAVLLFSNVVPLRTTGILLAATMLSSSLTSLGLMPALLIAGQPLNWNSLKNWLLLRVPKKQPKAPGNLLKKPEVLEP